mmetsp:Transcript_16429/g.34852  ORF Transcript_16429/g.34852 Transcript_16429/m.34852 type:complete len:330 (-) Transcript_16429:91-1080(-)
MDGGKDRLVLEVDVGLVVVDPAQERARCAAERVFGLAHNVGAVAVLDVAGVGGPAARARVVQADVVSELVQRHRDDAVLVEEAVPGDLDDPSGADCTLVVGSTAADVAKTGPAARAAAAGVRLFGQDELHVVVVAAGEAVGCGCGERGVLDSGVVAGARAVNVHRGDVEAEPRGAVVRVALEAQLDSIDALLDLGLGGTHVTNAVEIDANKEHRVLVDAGVWVDKRALDNWCAGNNCRHFAELGVRVHEIGWVSVRVNRAIVLETTAERLGLDVGLNLHGQLIVRGKLGRKLFPVWNVNLVGGRGTFTIAKGPFFFPVVLTSQVELAFH